MGKKYRIFIPENAGERVKESAGQVLNEVVIDEDTREQFKAKVMIACSAQEGYEQLVIQERGGNLPGEWYIKIVEREEEDDEITVFESMKLGDRRGYMLRSMMAEEKEKEKKEIMTSELEKRWKQKKDLVDKLMEKGKKKE